MNTIDDNLPITFIVPSIDDNVEIIIPYKFVKQWTTIKDMIDDIGADNLIPIPLTNISLDTINLIIKFADFNHQSPINISSQDNDIRTTSNTFVQNFFQNNDSPMQQSTLFSLILAANFLNFKILLDLCCKQIADLIKGKTPEQIRQTFNIKNDFTPEEEENIRKENQWCQ